MNSKCIILDFDKTLTKNHLYYYLRKDPSLCLKIIKDSSLDDKQNKIIIDYIWGGENRISLISNFLIYLTKMNIDIYISSYGYLDEIKYCLKYIGILKYFKAVHSCKDDFTFKNKTKYIHNYILLKYDTIIYVDDDKEEHKRLKTKFENLNITSKFFDYHQVSNEKVYIFYKCVVNGLDNDDIDKLKEII